MKQLADKTDPRRLYTIDALRYTLLLENKAHRTLWRALRSIETKDKSPHSHPSEETTLTAIGSAWKIIDMVHRSRGLVRQVPRLRQKTTEVQQFLRNTANVEEFRHLFQHLNADIGKIRGDFSPIMGGISWVTRDTSVAFTIMTGTSAENTNFHTMAFNTVKGRFSNNLVLGAGLKDIDLDGLHQRCKLFQTFFNGWLENQGMLSVKDQSVGIVRFHTSGFKAQR